MGYNVGPVKAHVQRAADTLGPKFGVRTIGGFRAVNDGGYHYLGRALDFMVTPAQGAQLSAYVWANRDVLGVIEVIWAQRIITTARAGEGWRTMGDRGSRTQNHMDHVHVSFGPGGSRLDALPAIGGAIVGAIGGLTGNGAAGKVGGNAVTGAGGVALDAAGGLLTGIDAVGKFAATLGEQRTWVRVMQVLGGAVLLVGGVVIVGKGTIVAAVADVLPAGKALKALT